MFSNFIICSIALFYFYNITLKASEKNRGCGSIIDLFFTLQFLKFETKGNNYKGVEWSQAIRLPIKYLPLGIQGWTAGGL